MATLYGRFAARTQPSPSSDSVHASGRSRPRAARGRDRARRHGLTERREQRGVDLDRHDVGAGLGERARERAEAGADLDDAVPGPHAPRRPRSRARGWGRSGSAGRGTAWVGCRGARRALAARRRRAARSRRRAHQAAAVARGRERGSVPGRRPGTEREGGRWMVSDAVSDGHDPHGREELPDRIRVRRALAHLPRTREPARTRPGMSRRLPTETEVSAEEVRALPTRSLRSVHHPDPHTDGAGPTVTTSHPRSRVPATLANVRPHRPSPPRNGASAVPRTRCGNRTLANPQLSMQP